MNEPLGIAVISYAHPHAAKYAAAIISHPEAQLVGIATLGENGDLAANEASRYGVAFFEEHERLLELEGTNAVYLGCEPGLHMEVVESAAEAGVHVLCDKPIATSLEEADQIIEQARAAGIKLMIPFNPRYQLPLMKFKEALVSGLAGELVSISAVKYGRLPTGIPGPGEYGWLLDEDRAGGGGFLDIGIHALDALRWLSGSEPRDVYADVGTKLHPELGVDDLGAVIVEFENGVIASLAAGWANPPGYPTWLDVRFEILTTSGAWIIDSPYHSYAVYGQERAERVPWWRVDVDGLVNEFVQAVLDDRDPAITGEDGRTALAMALASYESAQTGNVVRMP